MQTCFTRAPVGLAGGRVAARGARNPVRMSAAQNELGFKVRVRLPAFQWRQAGGARASRGGSGSLGWKVCAKSLGLQTEFNNIGGLQRWHSHRCTRLEVAAVRPPTLAQAHLDPRCHVVIGPLCPPASIISPYLASYRQPRARLAVPAPQEMRKGIKEASPDTILTPRFYTTGEWRRLGVGGLPQAAMAARGVLGPAACAVLLATPPNSHSPKINQQIRL